MLPALNFWQVASELKVIPGSEFRVAYEEAMKYGGKVVLGDRPMEVGWIFVLKFVECWMNSCGVVYKYYILH